MSKVWSPEQRAILKESFDTRQNRNIAINATAGGSKTTILVEIAHKLPKGSKAVFLAFSKAIVEELAERLPSGFEVMTLHSLGYKVLFQTYGSGLTLVDNKYKDLLFKVMESFRAEMQPKEYYALAFGLLEQWDWYRVTLDGNLLAGDDSVTEGKVWLKFLKEVEKINNPKKIKRGAKFAIDFTDMIWLVVHQQLRIPQWDEVLIDEAQDLNNCQHELMEMIIHKKGRLISVGDDEQTIFGFAGANPESFKKFTQRPHTVEMPLSITFRCPRQVVAHARQYSKKITAAPHAIEGEVREGTLDEVRPGDFILCRNNAPLIDTYFKLLAEDQKAYIKGKEIGEEYLRMVKPFERSHLQAIFDHWNERLQDLYDRLAAKGMKNIEKIDSYALLQEKILGLEIIARNVRNTREMLLKIEAIFAPKKDAIVLSTIHKAKGLEADRVFLLRWDLMFSKCETPEDEQQERNLAFVACTRPKKALIYLQEKEEEETKITLSY